MSTHAEEFSMNNKSFKFLAGFSLSLLSPMAAQAEVVIILPASGAMAAAAASVRDGIQAAYYAGKTKPALRFVDNSQRSMQDILAKEINAKTELVIGPLAREQVEQLVSSKPKVKVLALNQVSQSDKNVWQFALSPDEDARALTRRMQKDRVSEVLIITQAAQQRSTARFKDSMSRLWGDKLKDISDIPQQLNDHQGLLLLGDHQWLDTLKNLPHQKAYTIPLAIEENPSLPIGIQFCDTPALYQSKWPELISAYQAKPVNMAYQRLLAFGADAWQISTVILSGDPSAKFAGRTGQIHMVKNVIDRHPQCMTVEQGQLSFD
jgi:outer membrane PBP1 activator LpoA protein